MRLSELRGKEIVDINDGIKIGVLDECELVFDDTSGSIHSILIPNRNALSHFIGSNRAISIPWESVQKRICTKWNYPSKRCRSDDVRSYERIRRQSGIGKAANRFSFRR